MSAGELIAAVTSKAPDWPDNAALPEGTHTVMYRKDIADLTDEELADDHGRILPGASAHLSARVFDSQWCAEILALGRTPSEASEVCAARARSWFPAWRRASFTLRS